MTATLIDGKATAAQIKEDLKHTIQDRKAKSLPIPGLDVILVGDDPASAVYVRTKQKACETVGIKSRMHHLPADINQQHLENLIDKCNSDKDCNGILLQLPLPSHLNTNDLLERIAINKDVDGFHPFNMGRLAQGRGTLSPCTPHGVITLLRSSNIELEGKDAVVIGASNIVGRPMALELLAARCTVTICHSKTKDLASKVNSADILVVGIGRPGVVQTDWIKPGAVIIDIGFNRLQSGKIVGDIEFNTAKEIASYITPVPGGVGPMTVATLLENTLLATKIQYGEY